MSRYSCLQRVQELWRRKAFGEEIPYRKLTICIFLLMANSNHDRIRPILTVRETFITLKIAIFAHCIVIVGPLEELPATMYVINVNEIIINSNKRVYSEKDSKRL